MPWPVSVLMETQKKKGQTDERKEERENAVGIWDRPMTEPDWIRGSQNANLGFRVLAWARDGAGWPIGSRDPMTYSTNQSLQFRGRVADRVHGSHEQPNPTNVSNFFFFIFY